MGRFRKFHVREPATKFLAELRPAQPGRPPEEAEVAAEARYPRRPLDLGDDLHRAQVGARHEDAVRPLLWVLFDRPEGPSINEVRREFGPLPNFAIFQTRAIARKGDRPSKRLKVQV